MITDPHLLAKYLYDFFQAMHQRIELLHEYYKGKSWPDWWQEDQIYHAAAWHNGDQPEQQYLHYRGSALHHADARLPK